MAAENLTTERASSAVLDSSDQRGDSRGRNSRSRGFAARPVRNSLIAVVVASYAWIAGSEAPFSNKALISVLLPGAVLGAIAYGRPPERLAPPESIDLTGFSYWIICLASLFEWEASAFRDGSTSWHPALTDLVNPLIQAHTMKSAAIVVWLLAGWGLVKR